ncbi:hypothetical protein H2201_009266, partial [Coniosporium apollinis]
MKAVPKQAIVQPWELNVRPLRRVKSVVVRERPPESMMAHPESLHPAVVQAKRVPLPTEYKDRSLATLRNKRRPPHHRPQPPIPSFLLAITMERKRRMERKTAFLLDKWLRRPPMPTKIRK